MKNIHLCLAIVLMGLIGIFFIAGCGGKTASVHEDSFMADEFRDAPGWVITAGGEMEGGMASIGSAAIGQAGVGFARTEAMALARDELARQIDVKVQNMVKNFTQQIGVGDGQTVDKVAMQVSRQVTQQSLAGSRQQDSWISPSSTLYVLAVVDPESVQQYVKDSVLTSMNNEQALWQKFQAEQGFKALDEQIQKEFGGYGN